MSQTLLLADDSVTIQRVIELTFADEDVRVVAVSDGDQAIARLSSDPPDVVLADVGMPGRNGYEVAEFIKSSAKLAHVPVLLLTGAFEPIDEDRAKAAGCDGVLAKPFEPQMVISRVRELLARSAAARTQATVPAVESATLVESIAPSELPARLLVPPITPSRAPAAPVPPTPNAATEDYFDRLDAAFADLNQSAPTWPRPEPDTEPGTDPATEPEPERAIEAPPAALHVVPPLPDAFATLLEAERSGTALPASWPAAMGGELTEQVIDGIVERVLARMSDRVVRETVTHVVSEVTERLIRDEIERIKDQVK